MMALKQTAVISARGNDYPCQGTQAQMHAFYSAIAKKDHAGMREAMSQGGVMLKQGWKVRSIEQGGFLNITETRIRIESGPKAGATCWLASNVPIFNDIRY